MYTYLDRYIPCGLLPCSGRLRFVTGRASRKVISTGTVMANAFGHTKLAKDCGANGYDGIRVWRIVVDGGGRKLVKGL